MKTLLKVATGFQKKTTRTSYEMSLISILFGSKFLKTSIVVLLVNLVFHRDISLFEKGGLFIDLMVINLGRMFYEFIFYYAFDILHFFKLFKRKLLVSKVKKVIWKI